jgi:regulation of enolase protein 1 (concanavalin A-like superfamily)
LTDEELDAAVPKATKAFSPNPADGSMYPATSVTLSWQPGDYAASHHVYFSADFNDVNDRTERANKGITTELTYSVSGLVPGTWYFWAVDEINDANIWPGDVWSFEVQSLTPYNPDPYDGEISVGVSDILAWSPGISAVSHRIYLDKVRDKVEARSGCLVNGVNTTALSYNPSQLEFNTTYFWAVDEINGNTIYAGRVWSFTTMPDIPITDTNLIGWWTFDEGVGRTALDWSGHDNHGAIQDNPVWTVGYDGYGGALDFDGIGDYVNCGNAAIFDITEQITVTVWIKVEKFEQEWQGIVTKGDTAWRIVRDNKTNQVQFACDDAAALSGTINVNDGQWHHIAGVYDGSDIFLYVDGSVDVSDTATGTISTNTYNLLIGETERAGGKGRYWNGLIDDVRIYNKALTQEEIEQVMRGDPKLAYRPIPANRSILDIEHITSLSWVLGEGAVQHDVYFSTDANAVENADASDTTGIYCGRQDPNSFTPPITFKSAQTYYWRIDEIDGSGTVSKGRVWSFTIANYLVVDDFEQYNDVDNLIYDTWLDCVTNNTGMTVGHTEQGVSVAEQTIVHSGNQSMYMRYDNDGFINQGLGPPLEMTGTQFYSEAERRWDTTQDWTRRGVKGLTLWFRGVPASVGNFTAGPPITMTAGGADIWGTADEYHFDNKRLSGIGSITARVVSISNTDLWAKAGVMIRESLEPGSSHAAVVVTPGNGVSFPRRPLTNGNSESTTQAGLTAPLWVRLTRSGNTFTAEYSSNGTNWTMLGSPLDMPMLADVYVGLCLTSHNVNATCTAEFSNVTLPPSVTGQWQSQDIGIESNIAEQMYVVLEDSTGNSSPVIKYPDPTTTVIGSWTPWNIPLTDFAGVNLQAVSKLTIGVGDRANTQPGGAGDLYIDDIGLLLP